MVELHWFLWLAKLVWCRSKGMYICKYMIYNIYNYMCKLYKYLEAFRNEHNETLTLWKYQPMLKGKRFHLGKSFLTIFWLLKQTFEHNATCVHIHTVNDSNHCKISRNFVHPLSLEHFLTYNFFPTVSSTLKQASSKKRWHFKEQMIFQPAVLWRSNHKQWDFKLQKSCCLGLRSGSSGGSRRLRRSFGTKKRMKDDF